MAQVGKRLGAAHPRVSSVQMDVAEAMLAQGQVDEAETLLLQARKHIVEACGVAHGLRLSERGDGGGGAAAAGGAAGAAPPSTPPPVRAGGKGCGGEHDGQHRPSSGMTRALARLKGKRARTVVPVDADAGGGGSGEGGGVVAERDQQA